MLARAAAKAAASVSASRRAWRMYQQSAFDPCNGRPLIRGINIGISHYNTHTHVQDACGKAWSDIRQAAATASAGARDDPGRDAERNPDDFDGDGQNAATRRRGEATSMAADSAAANYTMNATCDAQHWRLRLTHTFGSSTSSTPRATVALVRLFGVPTPSPPARRSRARGAATGHR